ncbi:MAG TPA: DUF1697 domain-containing protein [Vicingus sp.]|nr:DUF1697 domain-containing protein [Vicingus sp.]
MKIKTYIALLRGINVSGHKLIKMSDLKILFENCGFNDVTTYIQSGNVVFSSAITNKKEIKSIIEKAIQSTFSFDVSTLILESQELETIKNYNIFLNKHPLALKSIYFTFFDEKPNQELVNELNQLHQETEFFSIAENVIHCYYPNGYGNSKWNNVFFEKKLKVNCTTRNYNTVNKLIEVANKKNTNYTNFRI